MTFLSANDPAYKRRLNLSDTSMPMDDKPVTGMVMGPDGRAYLVERGLRDVQQYAGQEGETQYSGGTDDWLWRDQKTGQEHYLSDYADKGVKLYDTSPQALQSLLDREGRGVFNRGGSKDGAWISSMSDADPNKYAGATSYFDVAEQADDADSLGYLHRINPGVRQQIFDAAGYSGGLPGMSPEDVARIERAMYKIDPMSFGGGFSEAGGDMGMDPSVGFGQASMGGVDPILGRATANPMGSYFRNIENLKWSPEFGLYNDGSAGFVKRKKQTALQQGMPFIAAAAALMGGAALLGPAMAAGAGGAGGAIGTGAELGFGGMLADAGVTSGALEGLGGTVFSGGELFANGALNLTENAYANSAITGALKNAAMSGITGNDITAKGLIGGALTGAASPFISDTLKGMDVTGTLNKTLTGAATGALGAGINGGDALKGAVTGGVGGAVGGMTGSGLLGAGASYLAGNAMNQSQAANNAVTASTQAVANTPAAAAQSGTATKQPTNFSIGQLSREIWG